jgi:hypothetical protein
MTNELTCSAIGCDRVVLVVERYVDFGLCIPMCHEHAVTYLTNAAIDSALGSLNQWPGRGRQPGEVAR